jgi:hypothetical protein
VLTPATGWNATVRDRARVVIVGGVFTKVDAVNHRALAFLNPSGTLVPSGAGGIVGTIDPDNFVYDITILPGDVALVSGAFTNFSGLPGRSIEVW